MIPLKSCAPARPVLLVLLLACGMVASGRGAGSPTGADAVPTVLVSTAEEPVAAGKFEPSWASLKQYRVPQWFQDAKFGIWAHWGPQCEPEHGDWYARNMYPDGGETRKFHEAKYGHPSRAGFKDVIHAWRAEKWDPDQLLALYRRAGAEYFMALANHHDNFDNWDSKYQPWNAARLGPQRDLIAGWAAAARRQGMRFGVSVHASHAWSWYEVAQGADRDGPLAGVPYDGKLTRDDGKGTWWEGYDPQDLYEQRHAPSPGFQELKSIHGRWDWGGGVTTPDLAYCQKFYNRTVDLINRYQPDLLYFDDTALPLWPVSDAGLKIAAHFYNSHNRWHDGAEDGVLFGKILDAEQRQCLAWDIERGSSDRMEPHPWQTDTCIGSWHYDARIFEQHRYKTAASVVRTLIDIVSKNGNLLLSVPVKGDGTIDSDEVAVLEGIAGWMEINREAIHGTRPWKVFGEGPQMAEARPMSGPGFNEGKGRPFTAEDVRFTTKGPVLYAIAMGRPGSSLRIRSLGREAGTYVGEIREVALLGSAEHLVWKRTADALEIECPAAVPNEIAVVFKISPLAADAAR